MSFPDLSRQLESALRRYTGLVRSIARRHRLEANEVDELLQAIRLRLWRAMEDERIEQVTSSYMYRTAMSASIDLLRARREHRTNPGDPAPILERVETPVRADAAIESEEQAGRILGLLEELPADRRTATKLYLAGYSAGEIADMLDWSAGRTRNLLHRGLEALRLRLSELGMGPPGSKS